MIDNKSRLVGIREGSKNSAKQRTHLNLIRVRQTLTESGDVPFGSEGLINRYNFYTIIQTINFIKKDTISESKI